MRLFWKNVLVATIATIFVIVLYHGFADLWVWFVTNFAYRGEVG